MRTDLDAPLKPGDVPDNDVDPADYRSAGADRLISFRVTTMPKGLSLASAPAHALDHRVLAVDALSAESHPDVVRVLDKHRHYVARITPEGAARVASFDPSIVEDQAADRTARRRAREMEEHEERVALGYAGAPPSPWGRHFGA